jgi:glycosyltransferase involved in cell wall biosynthesis
MSERSVNWICCQLGAREHYAIPRALHLRGALQALVTEAWVPAASPWALARRNLRERCHPDLPAELVYAWTSRTIAFEVEAKLRGWCGWEGILRRNDWFQGRVLSWLAGHRGRGFRRQEEPTLFSFSYTARRPFQRARREGMRTVLGQIDGGLGDELHLVDVHQRLGAAGGLFRPAPQRYWEQWREECELADAILVNSAWSRNLLARAGIAESKIQVVPLAYTPPDGSLGFVRQYPDGFDSSRPLRVLFLGQVSVRKGALELLEAAEMLTGKPLEWWMVGPEVFPLSPRLREQGQVRWFGAVPRGRVAEFYRAADVFLFPTHSDGFGLTQLEAQAWKLPIIASSHCGRVVVPGVNGLKLPSVSATEIVNAIEGCLRAPALLAQWSRQAHDLAEYGLESLAQRLSAL